MSQTVEQILNMPAGRELDALIAEKVMGFRWVYTEADVPWMRPGVSELKPPNWIKNADTLEPWLTMEGVEVRHGKGQRQDTASSYFPHYSTDIAAAWQVVVALEQKGGFCTVQNGCGGDTKGWRAEVIYGGTGHDSRLSPTAPLAICRAALLPFLS